MPPPTVPPAVAARMTGQNCAGFSVIRPKTTGSLPMGNSVPDSRATMKTVARLYRGRARAARRVARRGSSQDVIGKPGFVPA